MQNPAGGPAVCNRGFAAEDPIQIRKRRKSSVKMAKMANMANMVKMVKKVTRVTRANVIFWAFESKNLPIVKNQGPILLV